MIDYTNTRSSAVIGIHDGLRVTFAQTRSAFTPDAVEAADFKDNLNHLWRELADRPDTFAVSPVSDVVVDPGGLAATVDFMVPEGGVRVTVGTALDELHDGLYGPLDLFRRTYIRRVEKFGGGQWGEDIPTDQLDTPDEEQSWSGMIAKLGGIAVVGAVVVGAFVFAPEIKLALKARRAS